MSVDARHAAAHSSGARVAFVHGQSRIAKLVYELQRDARESVLRIGRPQAALVAEFDSMERDLLRRGVQFRTLHDRDWLRRSEHVDRTETMIGHGEQVRVAAGGPPLRMLLVDDEVAVLPLTTGHDALRLVVVARGGALVAAFGQIFDELWRTATPFDEAAVVPVEPGVPVERTAADRPTEQESSILSMLAAGVTDDGIGRRLGISARTAHRRVRELMERLGARNRFQAGAQAVRFGWL